MSITIKTNAVVFGGGVSGLWVMNILRKAGLQVILIEKDFIGGTQTLASQGMIHGGQRYALQGNSNAHSEMLKELPQIWNSCFSGAGILDLSTVKLLSPCQYMWSPGSLTSNVAAFLASKVMQGEVNKLSRKEWPEGLQENCGMFGVVYRLGEVVVDCSSLMKALFEPNKQYCLKANVLAFERNQERIQSAILQIGDEIINIEADLFIAAAGAGNEKLRDMVNAVEVKTQRRPLKQILVRNAPFDLYAHCITTDPRPRATITTHYDNEGRRIWYMGGLVGVYGIDKTDIEAIEFAQKEMFALFPKLNWDLVEWSVLSVDRAEPKVDSGFLPDGPQMATVGDNFLFMWPTKMTFAPALGVEVESWIANKGLSQVDAVSVAELSLPAVEMGMLPWEDIDWLSYSTLKTANL